MVTAEQTYTVPEGIVLEWLDRRKIPFQFQTSLSGGFFALGDAVVDFIVKENLAWRIMGEYWHQGIEKEGSNLIQREMLTGLGYTTVALLEDDLMNRSEETLIKALQGIEILR